MGVFHSTTYYGRKIDKHVMEWLYGDWNESKQKKFEFYYAIPGVHDYLDYLLDKRADSEYMARYGLTYTDVHDPRKLRQSSSGARVVNRGFNVVSRNINSLYRDAMRPRKKSKGRRR